MSFMDVMYGPLGSVNQGFQNNLASNAANAAAMNASVNSWQNIPQVSQAQLYGGGSFGAQPAAYAALAAAYGRATGGFGGAPGRVGTIGNPGGGGGGGSVPMPQARPFGLGATPFNPYGGGANPGGFSPSPNYRGGAAAAPVTNPYVQQYRMPQANPSYFNPGAYAGDQGSFGIPYRGVSLPGDIGFSRQPSYPNLGYNPGMQHQFANPAMSGGAFQSRFGMNFPNAGTPNQYAPGAQMPPGFSQLYSVDNPGGALPAQPGIYANSPFGN